MKKILIIVSMACFLIACEGKKDPLAQYQGLSAKQIDESAELQLKKGNYATAAEQFEALDNLYPFSPYAEQAQIDLMFAYYKNDDMPQALAAAERYIHLYPQGSRVDYAYYMKGLIEYKDGLTWLQQFFGLNPAKRDQQHMTEAYHAFNELVQRFPKSEYRQDALAHMAYIRNQIAQEEIEVARFYLYHKAYVAVVNRATDVINNYPQSPAVVKALALNVRAYRALKQPELANRYLELLRVNYPDSREYRRLSSS